jgi:hypothetical protein
MTSVAAIIGAAGTVVGCEKSICDKIKKTIIPDL